jgi:hypothetical protein
MNKIPVGQTVRFAYAFTFGEIGTIIGLIWIPTLINAIATFFVLRAYYGTLIDSFENGMPPSGGGLGWPLLLAFLAMLLVAMIGVAITQQAMGLRQGPAFARVSLGSAEWRAFGGFFGLYMLLVLFLAVFAMLVGGAGVATANAVQSNPSLAGLIAAVIGLGVIVGGLVVAYLVVRLSFLLVPSVVDGGEFGLSRSWLLTKGNFWRIVAIGFATLLPIAVAFAIAEIFILGPGVFVSNLQFGSDAAGRVRGMVVQMRAMRENMPILTGLTFVISPLLYGLMFSASAFAYRALSGAGSPVAHGKN